MKLTWKVIPGFSDYLVSNQGQVKSLKFGKERILSKRLDDKGYAMVNLCKPGVQKNHRVHKLVARLFLSNPNLKPEVNHKDGNKGNNAATNLEWVTRRENLDHAFSTKIHSNPKQPIFCIELNRIFSSQTEAIKTLGISNGGMYRILSGKINKVNGYTLRKI